MVAQPTISLDLPLKVRAWEAADGNVWPSYNDLDYLKQRFSLSDELLTLPCLKARGFLLHPSSLGLFLTPCLDTSTSTHGLPDRVWNDLTNSFSLSYTMSHVAEHCRW